MGRAAVAVIALGVALAFLGLAPVAQARFIRAPKWLKGPYRQYLLTYNATASSQGQSSTRPTAGCTGAVQISHGNSTIHWEGTYQFLFGRYRPPSGRYHTAFVFRLVHHGASGHVQTTLDTASPPGCPDDPGQHAHNACTEPIVDTGPQPLEISDLRPSHGASRYATMVLPDMDEGNCAEPDGIGGGGAGPPHFTAVHPPPATIIFTDRGAFARRTFQGTFESLRIPRSAQGTDNDAEGNPQTDWTFSWGLTGALKLAPVGR